MGILDLIKESKENSPKQKTSSEPRLKWIDMSRKSYIKADGTVVPSNRGIIKFVPIKAANGVDIKYAYNVLEYLYRTEEYSTMARLMEPKDYDQELTDENKTEILKCRSLIQHMFDLGYEFPDVSSKNYALMFGYILEHTSNDGTTVSNKESRQAALLIFPSKNVAKALTNCLIKMNGYGEEVAEEMYNDLFSRNLERENYLTVSFDRPEGSFGYECEISADAFDRKCMKILTPEELSAGKLTIPQEMIDFCGTQSASFFAGNSDDANDFNAEFFENVITQITAKLTQDEEATKVQESLPPIPSKNKKKSTDLDA